VTATFDRFAHRDWCHSEASQIFFDGQSDRLTLAKQIGALPIANWRSHPRIDRCLGDRVQVGLA
jgi:hypothetical protein